jgi:DNA modification methylase
MAHCCRSRFVLRLRHVRATAARNLARHLQSLTPTFQPHFHGGWYFVCCSPSPREFSMTKSEPGLNPEYAGALDASAGEQRLTIVYRPIDQLKPNPANPRRHSRAQLRRLAQIIQKFGFKVPALIDRAGLIIAGNGRWEAARQAGLTEIPTILVQDLSDAEIKAFIIADNRIAELGSWDDKILAQQFLELSEINPDLSLELTGFDIGEIDVRIESLAPSAPERPDPADAVPPGSGPTVTTRTGDAWQLEQHKVLCADARDGSSYARLLGTLRAAAVFTDPPYDVPIIGHASGLGRAHHRELAMASGEMSETQFAEFLATTLGHIARHSAANALVFLCMDWRHVWEALGAARNTGCALINICVWVKHNPGMGSLYRSQHEFVLVLKPGPSRRQLRHYGRNRSDVWHYLGANKFGRSEGEGTLLALHPTIKPVAMIADAIADCTKRDDFVLDPFLGSGSTLIAAERTGRRCYGIEIDPLYVDTAIRRWQAWTGGAVRHAATGVSFDEIAERREAGHGE